MVARLLIDINTAAEFHACGSAESSAAGATCKLSHKLSDMSCHMILIHSAGRIVAAECASMQSSARLRTPSVHASVFAMMRRGSKHT